MINDPRPGISIALNEGSKKAKGDIIAYLQDDVLVRPDWLSKLKYWFANLKDASAIGGSVYDHNLKPTRNSMENHPVLWKLYDLFFFGGHVMDYGLITEWGGYSFGNEAPSDVTEVTALPGANWAVSKEAYQNIGGFTEKLLYNGQDGLFFLSLTKNGYRLCSVPDMVVDHYPPTSGTQKQPYWLTREMVIFSHLLNKPGIRNKLKSTLFVYFHMLFWFISGSDQVLNNFIASLKGFRDGKMLKKKTNCDTPYN